MDRNESDRRTAGEALSDFIDDSSESLGDYLEDQKSDFTKKTKDQAGDNFGDLLHGISTGSIDYSKDNKIDYGSNDFIDSNKEQMSQKSEQSGEYKRNLAAANNKLRSLETRRESLVETYEDMIDEGKSETAEEILDEINKIDLKIENQINNKLGVTASQSFAAYAEASKADDYGAKLGYMMKSSIYDSVGGNLCCFIKLIFKSIEMEDDDENYSNLYEYVQHKESELRVEVDGINENMNDFKDEIDEELSDTLGFDVEEAIGYIDAIRGLLAMTYNKDEEKAGELLNSIIGIIMSPIKSALQVGVNMLRDIENYLVDKVKEGFGSLLEAESEPTSMIGEGDGFRDATKGLRECFTLEIIADFIFDIIDDFFRDLEMYLLDLYKMLYSQINKLDEDEILLGEQEWIKSTYKYLTVTSTILSGFNEFEMGYDLEEYINNKLKEAGLGYTYNRETGQMEEIDLGGCFDFTVDDGNSKTDIFNNPANIGKIDFSKDKGYQEFMENHGSLDICCEIEEEEQEAEKVLEEKNDDKVILEEEALAKANEIMKES